MSSFLETIKKRILLSDGAMGTELYRLGFFVNHCYESLNLTAPEKIRGIHESYVKAGSNIIQTNTFGANRHKLELFNLGDKLREINTKGVEIARDACTGRSVFIAGSIGPIGKSLPLARAVDFYTEHALALSEAGADLLILETFHDIFELEAAVNAIKKISSLPIVAQYAVNADEFNSVSSDDSENISSQMLVRVAERLDAMPADVVGLNCGMGPNGLLAAIPVIIAHTAKPVSCMPNAGHPEQVGDRMLYLSSPEYVGEYTGRMIRLGVRMTGGCCGTGPTHIKEMANVISSIQPRLTVQTVAQKKTEKKERAVNEIHVPDRSAFAAKVSAGKFVTSVEINPPKGIDCARQIASVKLLHAAGVDAVNIADGPRATSRMSPMAMAQQFHQAVPLDVIVHYCCRDRNIIGMQADLMGAASLGLNNVLLVTGDRPKLGDYPDATAVFDFDAIGLTHMAVSLNRGTDLIGNAIGRPASFFIGVGANPGAVNLDEEMARLEQKIAAGAQYIMTQPVFHIRYIEQFMLRLDKIGKIPVMLGILPLYSSKNAEFLHNEVPGMTIPEDLRKRMENAKTKEAGISEGITIARELLKTCQKGIAGAYIMPPFGMAQLAVDVLAGIAENIRK